MTIQTVTLSWVDVMLGLFFLFIWVEYKGSLVRDLARWIERKIKEKNQ